jgi:hypothetical protein
MVNLTIVQSMVNTEFVKRVTVIHPPTKKLIS